MNLLEEESKEKIEVFAPSIYIPSDLNLLTPEDDGVALEASSTCCVLRVSKSPLA